MRKILVLLAIMFGAATIAFAQVSYSTVTATVIDPNGNPYANATLTANLVNSAGYPVSSVSTPNGQLFNAKQVQATLDATGYFSIQLVPNNILTNPSGTYWAISIVYPQNTAILTTQSPWTTNYSATVTGPVDLSSQISALTQAVNFLNLATGQSTLVSTRGCQGGNTLANGCTGTTTAAGANLSITGVTQTGTLGTSSQVSTFPGTVAAGAANPTSLGSNGIVFPDSTTLPSAMAAVYYIGGGSQQYGDSITAGTGVAKGSDRYASKLQLAYGAGGAVWGYSGATCPEIVARKVYVSGVAASGAGSPLTTIECGANDATIFPLNSGALANAYHAVLSAIAFKGIPASRQINGGNYLNTQGSSSGTVVTTNTLNSDTLELTIAQLESAGSYVQWTTVDSSATSLDFNYLVNSGTTGVCAAVTVDGALADSPCNYGFSGQTISATINPSYTTVFDDPITLTPGATHVIRVTCASCTSSSPNIFGFAWAGSPMLTSSALTALTQAPPRVGVIGTPKQAADENPTYTVAYYNQLQSAAANAQSRGINAEFIPLRNSMGLDAATPNGSSSAITGCGFASGTATISAAADPGFITHQSILASGFAGSCSCLNQGLQMSVAYSGGSFTVVNPLACPTTGSFSDSGSVVSVQDSDMNGINVTLPNGALCVAAGTYGKHPNICGMDKIARAVRNVFPAVSSGPSVSQDLYNSANYTVQPSDSWLSQAGLTTLTFQDPSVYSQPQHFTVHNPGTFGNVTLAFTGTNFNCPTSLAPGFMLLVDANLVPGTSDWRCEIPPLQIITFQHTNLNVNGTITNTVIFAVPASDLYAIRAAATCLTFVAATSVTVSITWTDTSGYQHTSDSVTANCAVQGTASNASMTIIGNVEGSTNILETISKSGTGQTYDVRVSGTVLTQ